MDPALLMQSEYVFHPLLQLPFSQRYMFIDPFSSSQASKEEVIF